MWESSQIRDRTRVPCIGRWILYHRLSHQGNPCFWSVFWCFALKHCGHLSSPARDGTCNPCPGRWSLNHWTPGKPLTCQFNTTLPSTAWLLLATVNAREGLSSHLLWRRPWEARSPRRCRSSSAQRCPPLSAEGCMFLPAGGTAAGFRTEAPDTQTGNVTVKNPKHRIWRPPELAISAILGAVLWPPSPLLVLGLRVLITHNFGRLARKSEFRWVWGLTPPFFGKLPSHPHPRGCKGRVIMTPWPGRGWRADLPGGGGRADSRSLRLWLGIRQAAPGGSHAAGDTTVFASWDLDRNAGELGGGRWPHWSVLTGAPQPQARCVRERLCPLPQLVCPSTDLRLPKASSLGVCCPKCTARWEDWVSVLVTGGRWVRPRWS